MFRVGASAVLRAGRRALLRVTVAKPFPPYPAGEVAWGGSRKLPSGVLGRAGLTPTPDFLALDGAGEGLTELVGVPTYFPAQVLGADRPLCEADGIEDRRIIGPS